MTKTEALLELEFMRSVMNNSDDEFLEDSINLVAKHITGGPKPITCQDCQFYTHSGACTELEEFVTSSEFMKEYWVETPYDFSCNRAIRRKTDDKD